MQKIRKFIFQNMKTINRIYIGLLIFLLLFFFRRGDDFAFHMQRLNAISEEFKASGLTGIPIRIYHTTLNNYGYASPMFYGDIFLYPFAFMIVCGLSVINAYKIMHVCIVLSMFFTTRFSLKRVTTNENAVEIGTFLYMAGTSIFGNITGSILGRALAAVFVPLAISGIYSVLYSNRKYDWLYLALGMTGLIFSNIIDAAICVFTLFVIFLFSIKKVNVRRAGKIMLSAGICVCLSFWFIAPMIEQMLSGGGGICM